MGTAETRARRASRRRREERRAPFPVTQAPLWLTHWCLRTQRGHRSGRPLNATPPTRPPNITHPAPQMVPSQATMWAGHGIQAKNFVLVACFADVRPSAGTTALHNRRELFAHLSGHGLRFRTAPDRSDFFFRAERIHNELARRPHLEEPCWAAGGSARALSDGRPIRRTWAPHRDRIASGQGQDQNYPV